MPARSVGGRSTKPPVVTDTDELPRLPHTLAAQTMVVGVREASLALACNCTLMVTDPIIDESVLFAFEIENISAFPRSVARILKRIEGVTDVRVTLLSGRATDTRVEFKYLWRDDIVHEHYDTAQIGSERARIPGVPLERPPLLALAWPAVAARDADAERWR